MTFNGLVFHEWELVGFFYIIIDFWHIGDTHTLFSLYEPTNTCLLGLQVMLVTSRGEDILIN